MATNSTAWIDELSVSPNYFVNRDIERRRTVERVRDTIETGRRDKRFLVTGDRGVGKSIFMRTVAADLQAQLPGQLIVVEANARNIDLPEYLRRVARALAIALKQHLPEDLYKRRGYEHWSAELALLANNQRITRRQVETTGKTYGVQTGGKGGLIGFLEGSFGLSWAGRTETGTTVEETQDVTAEVLHAAIVAMLGRLAEDACTVVILFDDVDQALKSGDEAAVKQALSRVLDLAPCIGLVHLRSEVLTEDVRRELSREIIELEPLSEMTLLHILSRRVAAAPERIRADLESAESRDAFTRLARVANGNPLVFLSWLVTLADQFGLPPDPVWMSDDGLTAMARKSAFAFLDGAFLRQVARVVEHCSTTIGGVDHVAREDLLHGGSSLGPRGERLSEEALVELESRGHLLRRSRFDPRRGYRLDPALELLLPARVARLRGPA